MHQTAHFQPTLQHFVFQPFHALVKVRFAGQKALLIVVDGVPIVLQGGHFSGAVAGGVHIAQNIAAVDHAALFGHIFDGLNALVVKRRFVADDQRVAGVGGADGAGLHRGGSGTLPGTEAAVGVNAAADDGRAQKNGQQSFAAARLPGLFGLLELFPRLIIGVGLNGRHLRGNVGGDEGSALHGLRKIHRLHDGRRLLAVHAALRHKSARLLKGWHLLHGLRLLGPIARHDRRHLLRIIKRLALRRKGAGRNCAIGGREGSVCGLTVWRRNGAGRKAGRRSALTVEIRILLHRRSPSFCPSVNSVVFFRGRAAFSACPPWRAGAPAPGVPCGKPASGKRPSVWPSPAGPAAPHSAGAEAAFPAG